MVEVSNDVINAFNQLKISLYHFDIYRNIQPRTQGLSPCPFAPGSKRKILGMRLLATISANILTDGQTEKVHLLMMAKPRRCYKLYKITL